METDVKIYADEIDEGARQQIALAAHSRAFEGAKIRIMPDVHTGKGSVVGFTAVTTNGRIAPNVVGVDIGCGMSFIPIEEDEIDFMCLDRLIQKSIPSGKRVHQKGFTSNLMDKRFFKSMHCYEKLDSIQRFIASTGTLGAGNHFIEVDQDETGRYWIIIHSGSRSFGVKTAQYYESLAAEKTGAEADNQKTRQSIIESLKAQGRETEIESVLSTIRNMDSGNTGDLVYIEGEDAEHYIYDMRKCVQYAQRNRTQMINTIMNGMNFTSKQKYPTHVPHNYIEKTKDALIIRKGAISAKKGETVLIPLNMQKGCIIGTGKGNEDWNCSAPHGAGRRLSRSTALKHLSIDRFREQMDGIYTSSVNRITLDEAPDAYKDPDSILKALEPTVENMKILTPVYNFKAHDDYKSYNMRKRKS